MGKSFQKIIVTESSVGDERHGAETSIETQGVEQVEEPVRIELVYQVVVEVGGCDSIIT